MATKIEPMSTADLRGKATALAAETEAFHDPMKIKGRADLASAQLRGNAAGIAAAAADQSTNKMALMAGGVEDVKRDAITMQPDMQTEGFTSRGQALGLATEAAREQEGLVSMAIDAIAAFAANQEFMGILTGADERRIAAYTAEKTKNLTPDEKQVVMSATT